VPFKLSFPDLARRLARGLGVVGKTPVQLDETAIQTVLIRDLTLPEFSRVPTTWAMHTIAIGAVAEFGIGGVRCTSGIMVVEKAEASHFTFLTMQYRLVRQQTLDLASSAQLFVTNRPTEEIEVTSGREISASTAVPPGFIIQQDDPLNVAHRRLMQLLAPVVLFPGDELIAVPTGANTGLGVSMSGKQYPPLR